MADEPDNLAPHSLRRIDTNVAEMKEVLRDLQAHVTHVEEGMAGVHRRMDRIERRLESSATPR
jgi:hypothetical protein